MATLKSVKKFFDADAAVCPHCGSDDYNGQQLEVEGTRIYQNCSCSICKKDFTIAATVDTVMAGAFIYQCDDVNGDCKITRYKK